MLPKGICHDIYFATENGGKFREAQAELAKYGINLKQLAIRRLEIQSDSLEDIATFSAKTVAEQFKCKVVVEDAGLFINALKGFPGPFSSYVYRTIGIEGILKLLRGESNRNAFFKSVVSYCEPGLSPVTFTGLAEGAISLEPRGNLGFGFDPIFIPRGSDRTFAEMTVEQKNTFSHRAKSFRLFAEYIRMRG